MRKFKTNMIMMYGCPVPDEDDNRRHNEIIKLAVPNPNAPVKVEIKQQNGRIEFDFSSDCGSFGTNESLCGYSLTPEKLLMILNGYGSYSDDEII
jgi:hypothetical protein